MLGSLLVYVGLVLAGAGLVFVVKPIPRLGVQSRVRGRSIAAAGVAVLGAGFALPAPEARVSRAETRLDAFAPAWQFNEVHAIRIAAPPSRVFEAIREVRADEIFLFRTLTWIRRGGRPLPGNILDAGSRESLIDVALGSGFVQLAEEVPRELVVGTAVVVPSGTRGPLTPQFFAQPLPPGFALATMNFLVTPDGATGSVLSTETRVFANDSSSRRRFAVYWRVIYPGSAFIRRSWLRAIERRAAALDGTATRGRVRWFDVGTIVHGLLTLTAALFDVWFWVTHGFRVPRYIHIMALVAVVIGVWLWSVVPPDAPARSWGAFGPVFGIFALPALVYGFFVILGGARAAAD